MRLLASLPYTWNAHAALVRQAGLRDALVDALRAPCRSPACGPLLVYAVALVFYTQTALALYTCLCYLGDYREEGADMARTNIDLDDRLVEEGLRVFKCKTKKELIHLALQELLKTEKRKEILKLRGRLQWEGDLEETRRSRL
jgi:Arc/MetJ family transcription regulator